jgi:ATP-binding cassette subfamily B protein
MGPVGGRRTGEVTPIGPGTVRRVIGTFKLYILQIVVIGITVLLSASLSILSPFFLRTIVNRGLIAHNLAVVTRYTLYTLLVTVASALASLLYGYLSVLVGQHIMRDLRNSLYAHLQGMALKWFTSTKTGEIQSRLANDIGGVQSVVSDSVATLLNNVTTVLSTLAAMIYMDWRLTLLSVGILPVFALIGAKVGDVARRVRSNTQKYLAEMSATMQETLSVSGILLSKTSGRKALALKQFAAVNESMTGSQIEQSMVSRSFFNLIGLTFSITPVLVYWLAGYLISHDQGRSLTLGTIVAFTSLQARLFFPLTGLLNVQVEISGSLALFDRIFEYLDLKQEIIDSPDAVNISSNNVRGNVEFRDVSFSYDSLSERPTLQNVNFRVKAGSLVALVGHSGAGKTTITYLIPRLYDVTSGSVLIDGRDVRSIKLESLGQFIGIVTQETYLVHDSIRENLRYGNPDATDDQIVEAAKVAAIHNHIVSLPNGYDTIVGERGYKLSGGEKQRLVIARALLKNPRILILDEATSALDTESERLVQNALVPLMSGRTTFAIAHRLSTIIAADVILVIDKGNVVEQGTHKSLLEQNGIYARLYAAQFNDTSEPSTRDTTNSFYKAGQIA